MTYQPVPGVFINPALIDGDVRIEWVPSPTSNVAGTTSVFTVAGTGAPRPALALPQQPGQPTQNQDYFGSRRQSSDPKPLEVYEETEEEKARRKKALGRGGKRGGRKPGPSRKTTTTKNVLGAPDANATILISDDIADNNNALAPAPLLTEKTKAKRKASHSLDGAPEANQEGAWVTDSVEDSENDLDNDDAQSNVLAGPSDRERRKSARDSKKEITTTSDLTTNPRPAKRSRTISTEEVRASDQDSEAKNPVRAHTWRAGLTHEQRKKLVEPALRAKKIKDDEKKRKREMEHLEKSNVQRINSAEATPAATKVYSQEASRSSSRRKSTAAAVASSNKSAIDGNDTTMEHVENTNPEEPHGTKQVVILRMQPGHLRRFADVSQG